MSIWCPHDLHQLGFELKKLGKVFMFYYPEDHKNPINTNYKIYDLPLQTLQKI